MMGIAVTAAQAWRPTRQGEPVNPIRTVLARCTLAALVALARPALALEHFAQGSVIPADVTVETADGGQVPLLQLFAAQPGHVNVLFIFGGGDLGSAQPGHLWCQDSFEDTHILRTLHGQFRGKAVGFVAVAAAPVYHSGALGAKNRVFLDAAQDSAEYRAARQSFVDSTLRARANGILPIDPHFDPRFRLMLNRAERFLLGPGFGPLADWHGAFRAADEKQFYGVPGFWLIRDDGTVLAAPFRGNVYHPHGADLHIRYTYSDVDAALQRALAAGG